jgi:hypothetical protein
MSSLKERVREIVEKELYNQAYGSLADSVADVTVEKKIDQATELILSEFAKEIEGMKRPTQISITNGVMTDYYNQALTDLKQRIGENK